MKRFHAYIDGACKGNPGPAAIGIFITDDEQNIVSQISEPLGVKTNNQAEYLALIRLLKEFANEKIPLQTNDRIVIYSDSQLLVRQMLGLFKIKNKGIIKLHLEVRRLLNLIDIKVSFRQIPRSENKKADRLANLALNKGSESDGRVPHLRDEESPNSTGQDAS